MAKPEKVIDNEARRLHHDIDWRDRQNSIEDICEEIDNLPEHSTPSQLWNMLNTIREKFSEFIE